MTTPRGGGSPGGELSEREIAIIDLIARGLTNDEITQRLYISINTIKTYIRSAYRKMGVTTRVEAVLWALHHGLGDPTLGPVSPGSVTHLHVPELEATDDQLG